MAAACGTEKVLNFLLIGRTGEGKSATGNTILGQRLFRQSANTDSVTQKVVDKFVHFDDFILKVVDTPGLMDTTMNSSQDTEAAAKNMGIALGKSCDGVDAFILVIKRERFTGEQRKTLEVLKQIFGDQYLKNLIVVVTHADKFQEDITEDDDENITFRQWCGKQVGDFKELFDEFNDRFLHINNREKDSQKQDAQRREIIKLADALRKLNGRYTSKCFEEAKALRDKLIIEENKPMLNKTIQTKVGVLVTDLNKLQTTPSQCQRESIQQSVNDLKREITEKDKGTGLLNHLLTEVEKVETALHDIDELHRLAKKLEDSREDKAGWYTYGKRFAGLTFVSAVVFGGAAAALTVAAAPVVVGTAAAGGLLSGVGSVVGAIQTNKSITEHKNVSMTEKQINAEKDALDSKLSKVTMNSEKSTNQPHK